MILVHVPITGCAIDNTMNKEKETIGSAKLLEDGTIVLQLRIEEGSLIGDSLIEYKPGDPNYEEVKKHVGDLKVGEEKLIPPWPDE
jgi:hypothetical protein